LVIWEKLKLNRETIWQMKRVFFCRLSCLLILFIFQARAMAGEHKLPSDTTTAESSVRFLFAPFLDYAPETKWGFGGAGICYFRLSDSPTGRPSSVKGALTYTQLNQIILDAFADIFLDGGGRITADFAYLRFPDRFYGIGAKTTESMQEDFTPQYYRIRLTALTNVFQSLNVGVQYLGRQYGIKSSDELSSIAQGRVFGSEGGWISGVGVVANWDSRDNVFFPAVGGYYEFSATFFGRALGSDYTFSRYTLDLRQYISTFAGQVFAVQGIWNYSTDGTPFMMLPIIGGQYQMRGFYEGRFRDNHLLVFQADYRIPVWWRFGVNVFGSIGTVAPRLSAFSIADLKSSFGAGLRVMIDEREKLNIRLDYALTKETSGFYLTVEEAF
jgi:hypothetical protein